MVIEKTKISGRVRYKKSIAGKVMYISDWVENLIMNGTNTGKNLVAQRLGGINTYSLNLTHADIGTGTTAPAVSDTTLETAVTRVARTDQTVISNVVTVSFFFPAMDLPNDDYTEFGTFVDGTASVDTGKIFNRVLIDITKGTNEDITVEVEFTIT